MGIESPGFWHEALEDVDFSGVDICGQETTVQNPGRKLTPTDYKYIRMRYRALLAIHGFFTAWGDSSFERNKKIRDAVANIPADIAGYAKGLGASDAEVREIMVQYRVRQPRATFIDRAKARIWDSIRFL